MNDIEVTSCCGYELMYKKVAPNCYEEWEFCGMCLRSSWEPITQEQFDGEQKKVSDVV